MPNRILRDWTDSYTMDATTDAQEAFFTRLLMAVDDFGRYTADPRLLLARLYPLRAGRTDADHVRSMRDACAAHMLITLYMDGGKEYLQVANWQNVPRAKHSKFPECTADAQHMHSTCTAYAPVTGTVTEDRKPKPKTNNRREQSQTFAPIACPETLPANIDAPEVRALIVEWLSMRKATRKPATVRAVAEGIADLAKFGGVPEAVASLKASIMGNWTGLFPPKPDAVKSLPEPKRYDETGRELF